MSELDLLKRLKPHPNVIRLLGCITKDVIRRRGKREFSKLACFVKSTKSIARKLERELFYKFFINFCKLIGELDFIFLDSHIRSLARVWTMSWCLLQTVFLHPECIIN